MFSIAPPIPNIHFYFKAVGESGCKAGIPLEGSYFGGANSRDVNN